MRSLVLALLLGVTGCAGPSGTAVMVDGVVVESWELVEPTEMNEEIAAAVSRGEDWPTSPLSATLFLLGGDTAGSVRLESRLATEGADSSVVVAVRDGFFGDSVRGDWHRIVYRRRADGSWRIESVQRAIRCYRGHHQESYSRSSCL